MDAFGTITHDYETPLIDNRKKNSMKNYDSDYHKAYMQKYNDNFIRAYKHGGIKINPKWGLCYGGR